MKIGFIGLGKMGFNMVLNLHAKRFDTVVYDINPEAIRQIKKQGVQTADSLKELLANLPPQKIIWLMIPAGKPVDALIRKIMPCLNKADVIIDGGNSFYEDSIRRYRYLKARGIHFVDIGTSGGLQGARHGASLTVGGDKKIFKKIEPLCKALSAKKGYVYVGSAGSGHFVKMVHNAIEYAVLQSYADGFELLFKGPYKDLDAIKIAETWQHGSVIRSWLLELLIDVLKEYPKLSQIKGIAGGGETGQWAIYTAKKYRVPLESVKLALALRKKTRKNPSFTGKIIAALRNQFGGHSIME